MAGTQAQAALRLGFLTCQTVCLQLEERRPKSSLQLGLQEVLSANRPPANGGNWTFWQVWGPPPPPPHQRITSGAPSTAPSPHTLATEALSLRGPQRWAAVPAGPVLGLRQQQAPPVQVAGRTCHLALDARTPPSSSGSSNASWLPSRCMPAKGSSVLRRSPARQTLSPAGNCVSDPRPHLKRRPHGNGVPPGVQGRAGEGGQTVHSL